MYVYTKKIWNILKILKFFSRKVNKLRQKKEAQVKDCMNLNLKKKDEVVFWRGKKEGVIEKICRVVH